jgi:Protein of unknown function (DUF1800)
VVRTQFKTPIEHVVGAVRGLGVAGPAIGALNVGTLLTGEPPFIPPSVFSFYRPGHKGSLVNAAYVVARDRFTDALVDARPEKHLDAFWDAGAMIRRRRLARMPERAVDLLARDLLAAPPSPILRAVLLKYIGETVTEEKLRGAAWLVLTSPEYQAN